MTPPNLSSLLAAATMHPPGYVPRTRAEAESCDKAGHARQELAARCNPAVMAKVYAALEISERYLFSTPLEGALDAHAKVEAALKLLNGVPTP